MKKYMIATVAALLLTGVSIPSMATASPSNRSTSLDNQTQVTTVKKKKKKAKKSVRKQSVNRPAVANTQRSAQTRSVTRTQTVQRQTVANTQHSTQTRSVTRTQTAQGQQAVRRAANAPLPPPLPKCQFLFWEYDCPPEEKAYQDEARYVASAGRPVHIKKAEQMIGMDARRSDDRRHLKQYFASNLSNSIDPARIPWCAAWVNAVLADTGHDTTDSLMARSFLNYGTAIRNPRKGDIVVLRRGRSQYTGHVGFFIERVTIDGTTYVAVLGGNQDKAVNVAYYRENQVLGYRKPVPA